MSFTDYWLEQHISYLSSQSDSSRQWALVNINNVYKNARCCTPFMSIRKREGLKRNVMKHQVYCKSWVFRGRHYWVLSIQLFLITQYWMIFINTIFRLKRSTTIFFFTLRVQSKIKLNGFWFDMESMWWNSRLLLRDGLIVVHRLFCCCWYSFYWRTVCTNH